jgi:hypothetical protein
MLELAKNKSKHEIEIIASPRLVREQEMVRQVGDRDRLNKITSRNPYFSIEDMTKWVLGHN